MRRKTRINYFLSAFLFLLGVGFGFYLGAKTAAPAPNTASATTAAPYAKPAAAMPTQSAEIIPKDNDNAYLIKSYDGLIGVYKIENENELFLEYVINSPVQNLRPDDQARLDEGIPASTRVEMIKLVEDFSN